MTDRDLSDFDFSVMRTDDMTPADREHAFALFDVAYRQANHAYLEKSFGVLRYFAIATQEGEPAGFSLAEMRVMDLPRLPGQSVTLAGICCIAPRFRRQGLFGALEQRAMQAAGPSPTARILACGRMAHPASYRTMTRNGPAVPKPGVTPTPWQQEVGAAIAAAYGVAHFDPETFVCHGNGEPIGYPAMQLESIPASGRSSRRSIAIRATRCSGFHGCRTRPKAGDRQR